MRSNRQRPSRTPLLIPAFGVITLALALVMGLHGEVRADTSGGSTGGGSMVYPGAGVANSTGSAWGTSYTVGVGASNLPQLDSAGGLPIGGTSSNFMRLIKSTDSLNNYPLTFEVADDSAIGYGKISQLYFQTGNFNAANSTISIRAGSNPVVTMSSGGVFGLASGATANVNDANAIGWSLCAGGGWCAGNGSPADASVPVKASSFAVGTCLVLSGSGSPEGVVTAPHCSTYQRTDGGAGTSYYVKETGSGNTGWVAK